ncbi:MAG: imelysin family protein [Spongiibacteraceae bacterium]
MQIRTKLTCLEIQHISKACISGFLLLVTALTSACSPAKNDNILQQTADAVILPGYQSFAEKNKLLHVKSVSFCKRDERTIDDYEDLRGQWQRSVDAWSAVQSLQFGPILENNLAWSIQFWPDRKNLIAKKTKALLRSDDPLNQQRVAKASVVVHGLSALEYLLFDDVAGTLAQYQLPAGQRRCELLQAITSQLANNAEHLYQAWQPDAGNYRARFSHPGDDNAEYPSRDIALGAILDSLVYGLEIIKNDKLQKPLGLSDTQQPQPYLLEWWRSEYSIQAVRQNIVALERLYSAGDKFGLADYLQENNQQVLNEKISAAFQHSLVASGSIDSSLFKAAKNGSDSKIASLHKELATLLLLLKNELPQALGIQLGFNANDGD